MDYRIGHEDHGKEEHDGVSAQAPFGLGGHVQQAGALHIRQNL